jgi:hypothetical protein
MAINRDINKQVWAVLTNDEYEQLKQLAEDQERSISKQAAYIIKQHLKMCKDDKK